MMKLTWEECVHLDPRLADLERAAIAWRASTRSSDWLTPWYSELKPMVVRAVGWCRSDIEPDSPLATSAAYDCVYRHLLDIVRSRPRRSRSRRAA
jgi:hypothetical protein